MKKDIAVSLQNISKVYKLYDKPVDRLKESMHLLKKKYHKEFYAIKNINLDIKKGEVLGIVGVNGAGKSTLLKIISGVLTPTSGRVNICGRINAILELGSSLKPEMTGRENIKLNLQINGIEKDREDLLKEIIEFADIGEHIDQPVKSYSSGMKARLGFAVATSTNPDILIVDEVLAVGDILFQKKCYTKIKELFKNGRTVIFVSHNGQSIIEFCTRAILLYDKKIIMNDKPKNVINYYEQLIFNKNNSTVLNEIKILNNTSNFIKGYKSKETNISFGYNVQMSEFEIKDNKNNLVNILVHNEEYIFKYKVELNITGEFSFGNQIVDKKGLIISGVSLNNKKERFVNERKRVIIVSCKFKCYLSQGEYFINVNSSIYINNKPIPLCRVQNAYLFKVKKNKNSYLGRGFVDLNQIIEVDNV